MRISGAWSGFPDSSHSDSIGNPIAVSSWIISKVKRFLNQLQLLRSYTFR